MVLSLGDGFEVRLENLRDAGVEVETDLLSRISQIFL